MPRRNFQDGQEIVLQDFNALSAGLERGLFDRIIYEMLERTQNAFFGDSFKVSFTSPNSILVNKGSGFQYDSSQVSPEPNYRHLYLATNTPVTLQSPDSVHDRIDLVCVKAALATELTDTRKYKDPISSVVTTQTMITQQDWSATVQIAVGTPAASPVAPSVPSGYIAIAQLYVTAVTGMAGTGAVTDSRSLMPVGSTIFFDTTGYQRIPASSNTLLSAALAAIDSFLVAGHQSYIDLDDLSSVPSVPSSGRQRFYSKGGVAYFENSSGAITPLGSGGGGGGGGAAWAAVGGAGPIEQYEFDEKVLSFSSGLGQQSTLWIKVPSGYLTGRPIKMKLTHYSPDATNNFKFQATATLIRKNTDAINSVANQYISTNTDQPMSVAYQSTEVVYDLTTTVGSINGFSVSPGDLLKVVLQRTTPAGADGSSDVRMIPSSTEVTF